MCEQMLSVGLTGSYDCPNIAAGGIDRLRRGRLVHARHDAGAAEALVELKGPRG